mmetsp:Transcript_19414/g.29391  ORF Transcript_19414/g.29391 Transcript_19414/m.29391 type:complete len:294 (+) Transcript_19414:67-948(+)
MNSSTPPPPPQDQSVSLSGKTNEIIASSASTMSIPSSSSNNMSASASATPMPAPNDSSSSNNSNAEADNASSPTFSSLSPYEVFRAKNIERNQRRLASLGLVSEVEAQKIIDSAWKKTQSQAQTQTKTQTQAQISPNGNTHKKQKMTTTNENESGKNEPNGQDGIDRQDGIDQPISIKVGKGGAKKRILDRASLSQISNTANVSPSLSDNVCATVNMNTTSTCITCLRSINDCNANSSPISKRMITEKVSSGQNRRIHPTIQIITPTSISKQKRIMNFAIDPEDLTTEDGIWC